MYVGVGRNPSKKPVFTEEHRIELIRKITNHIDLDIEPVVITGLVADFVKDHKIDFLVRGVRSHADLDAEIIMGVMNRKLSDAETVLLMAKEGKIHISSTTIRTLGKFNKKLHNFVPDIIEDEVYDHIFKSFSHKNSS